MICAGRTPCTYHFSGVLRLRLNVRGADIMWGISETHLVVAKRNPHQGNYL